MKRRDSRSTARSVTLIVTLLGVLAAAVAYVAVALANSTLPAPTISAEPANPTSSQSASFTYTDSQTVTKFQCELDGAGYADCGTTRPSTKTYPGLLAAGSHTFDVRAVSGTKTSSTASYTWTIDRTAPTVLSINRAGSSPTNTSSVQWTVTFSENVTGVDKTDFVLVKTGLGGSPSVTALSGSGAGYTVTASTGSGSGTLGLNLVDNDSVKDAAANPLGGQGPGNGNFTGQVYAIDRTPPPAPVLDPPLPPAKTTATTITVYFHDTEPGVAFQCNVEEATEGWVPCTSGQTFTVHDEDAATEDEDERYTFEVRAVDAAGNVSGTTSFIWTITPARSGLPFTVNGGAINTLYPGITSPIDLVFTNPNAVPITVTVVTASISGTSDPTNCPVAGNFSIGRQLQVARRRACRCDQVIIEPRCGAVEVADGRDGQPAGQPERLPKQDRQPQLHGERALMRRALAILSLRCALAPSLAALAEALPRTDASEKHAADPPERAPAAPACPPPRPRRRGRAWSLRVLALAAVLGVALLGGRAWAFWSAGTQGATASGVAASVNQATGLARAGASPTANPNVQLTWDASQLSNGHAVDGYLVDRYVGSSATPVCGSSPTPLNAVTCTNPAVPDGTYSYGLSGRFASWTGPESSQISVTVDTSAPSITGPHSPSANASPSFIFSHPSYSNFRCSLDAAGFAPCTSPDTLSGLADGPHTFSVEALDADGVATRIADYAWKIDTSPPALGSTPSDPSANASPSVAFSHSSYSSLECRLDGESGFSPCTSPDTLSGLADGQHTFSVEAVDADGVPTQIASFAWTVSTVAPTITAEPSDPSNTRAPTFAFLHGHYSSFICRLDGIGTFAVGQCSPSSLADGSHHLEVEAQAADGSSTAAASYTWTIDASAPSVDVEQASGQLDPTGALPIHFTATFNEPVNVLGPSGITLDGTADHSSATITVTQVSSSVYDIAVSGLGSSGTLLASVTTGATTDPAGNGNTASTSTDNSVTYSGS